jgi:predicted lysophospholipase L1 biosynthesis ABC-type transport system permease subunit
MLKQEGRISAILALKCLCEGMNIENIRKEILGILPDTRVVEFTIPSLARDRARGRAGTMAKASLDAEKEHQLSMKREREKFFAWLIPIVIIGGAVWTGLLFFANAKERKMEIAILSALGLRTKHILQVFLLKAVIMGFTGGLIGYLAGFLFGVFSAHLPLDLNMAALLYSPRVFWGSLVAPPFLCMTASFIPALLAAWQNPAEIFTRE